MTTIPCRTIEYPTMQDAEVAKDIAQATTCRPHEVYLCPEMHWHVQEVAA